MGVVWVESAAGGGGGATRSECTAVFFESSGTCAPFTLSTTLPPYSPAGGIWHLDTQIVAHLHQYEGRDCYYFILQRNFWKLLSLHLHNIIILLPSLLMIIISSLHTLMNLTLGCSSANSAMTSFICLHGWDQGAQK